MARRRRRFPDGVLALPNLLTLARVPLGLAMWVAPADPAYAFSVMGAAALSDVLDGWFARRIRDWRWRKGGDRGAYAAGAGLGAFLDPLCDKFFVTSALLAVLFAASPPVHLIVLVGAREVLVAPLMLAYRLLPGPWKTQGLDFTAGWPGKVTTVLQFLALALAILAHPAFEAMAYACAGAGVFAVGWYLRRALAGAKPAPRGP